MSQRSKLDLCIYLYENGKYAEALDSLKSLIPNVTDKRALAECYKYLGFTSVMLDMINSAKDNFNKMLAEYPDMEIDTIQVPPNITIVFKQVVTEKELEQKKKRETELTRKSSLVITGTTGVLGLTAAALGVVFYVKESRAYDRYRSARDPEQIRDYRTDSENSLLLSRIFFGTSAAALLFTGYRLFTLPQKGASVSLRFEPGRVLLCRNF